MTPGWLLANCGSSAINLFAKTKEALAEGFFAEMIERRLLVVVAKVDSDSEAIEQIT